MNGMKNEQADGGQRLVAFGKFAGLAGMIDAFHGLGERLLSIGYQSPFMGISMSYMYPSVENAKRVSHRVSWLPFSLL
jgi:alpha-aminoadipic semialdehyde synthase